MTHNSLDNEKSDRSWNGHFTAIAVIYNQKTSFLFAIEQQIKLKLLLKNKRVNIPQGCFATEMAQTQGAYGVHKFGMVFFNNFLTKLMSVRKFT